MNTDLETWDQPPKYHQHQGLRTGEAPSTVFDFAHLSSQTSQKRFPPCRPGICGWQIVNTSNSLTKHGARCQSHTPTLITLLGKENRLHTSSFWRNRGCEERHPLPAPWFSCRRSAVVLTLPTQSWSEGRDSACPSQGRAAQGARLRGKDAVLQYLKAVPQRYLHGDPSTAKRLFKHFIETRRSHEMDPLLHQSQAASKYRNCQGTWIGRDLQTMQPALHPGGSMEDKLGKSLTF